MSFAADSLHQRGPRPGDVVAGRYRVDRVLGAGGMGVVVAATHIHLGGQVALKFLLPKMAGETTHDQLVARFVREAQLAVRIKSPHVARVHDVGTREGGEPYMVMELLDGEDLNSLSRRRGPLPVAEAADYVLQACEAVAEAHELGIVHRDLKPANLFVVRGPDGWPLVKVLDFGISKLVGGTRGPTDVSLTSDADVLGSPLYMAPEQIRNPKGVDARCDLWSLGAILYKLLAGKAAFEADNPATVLALILSDSPDPLREARPDVPEALEALVMRCLQKDPAQRTPSVDALAHGLLAFAPSRPRGRVWAPAEGADRTASGIAHSNIPAAPADRARPPDRRRRARVAAGITAGVVGLGGAITVVVLARGDRPAAGAGRAAGVGEAVTAPAPITAPPSASTAAPSAPPPTGATASASAAPLAPSASAAPRAAPRSGARPSSSGQPRTKEPKPFDPLEERN